MIESITYHGPLISDTSIPGERMADGIIPAHPGCCRLSENRWLITFATLDPRGWDSNHSIVYQIRDSGPAGQIIREGLLASFDDSWDPFGRGDKFSKRLGMAVPFGAPKGATHNGELLPNGNVFVIKWYRRPFLMRDGKCISTTDVHNPGAWPGGEEIEARTLRVDWMQVRLNEAEDDLEIIQPEQTLRQVGYNSDEEFCSLGPRRQMNHSMVPPIAVDEACREWIEFDTFTPYDISNTTFGQVAPIRYRFDEESRLYQWVETGNLLTVDGWRISESSLILLDEGDWLIGFRSQTTNDNNLKYAQLWFRGEDPFAKLSGPWQTPLYPAPRHSYLCPDGVVRVFANEKFDRWRDPLCSWDVDLETFELKNRHQVVDLRAAGHPFHNPGADMCKLCPTGPGNKQTLIFRAITLKQTAEPCADPPATPEEHIAAGVHYAEIEYDESLPDEWNFG